MKHNRAPVKREGAEEYLLLSLISFGGTVITTRLLLEITNYPQLGNSELHIAHVLWGGLVLFASALLPLIFANRWALTLSSLLSGVGVGLFIDEIGKFITRTNDYFYQPAAPIIYALFLITVLIYLRVRKPHKRSSRSDMYRALSILTEVLDSDLDSQERRELLSLLGSVKQSNESQSLTQLSMDLTEYVNSEFIPSIPDRPTWFARVNEKMNYVFEHIFKKSLHRWIIIVGLMLMGLYAAYEIWSLLTISLHGTLPFYAIKTGLSPTDLLWHVIRLALEGLVGILALVSAFFLYIKRENFGLYLGNISLLLQLTAIDLLVFYLDQFSASISAILQLILLLILHDYRRRYHLPSIKSQ